MKNLSTFVVPISIALFLTGAVVIYSNATRKHAIVPTYTPSPTASVDTTPRRTTIEGTIVCLPHKNTSGPQTEECAIGVQTPEGLYYALDTNLMSSSTTSVLYNTGNTIRADGLLTPIENLSSDHWQKYNVQGIFSVRESIEGINNTP